MTILPASKSRKWLMRNKESILPSCFITHWSLILFFPLIRALFYAYSTLTAIFNWFLFAVCVILAETLDLRKIDCNFYQGSAKLHISGVSYLINFLPPKGTPPMLKLAAYKFLACSSKRFICRHDRSLTLLYVRNITQNCNVASPSWRLTPL